MLSRIPLEILEEIALQLVESQPLGPPSDIIDLSTTCSRIHDHLSNPSFLARIFKFKFDTTAIRRRSVVSINSSGYADQLKKYCHVLKVIRSNDFDSLDIEEALFSAFIMMLENDGKNQCQLDWAGLDAYLLRYLREKLYEDAEASNGWPAENPSNALALWLMWMNTTEGEFIFVFSSLSLITALRLIAKLHAETPEQRLEVINMILPFVTIAYRVCAHYFRILDILAHRHSILVSCVPFPSKSFQYPSSKPEHGRSHVHRDRTWPFSNLPQRCVDAVPLWPRPTAPCHSASDNYPSKAPLLFSSRSNPLRYSTSPSIDSRPRKSTRHHRDWPNARRRARVQCTQGSPCDTRNEMALVGGSLRPRDCASRIRSVFP